MRFSRFVQTLRHLRRRTIARGPAQGRRATDSALEAIREDERTHIARELHDDLGQLLATLRVELTLLKQLPPGATSAAELMDNMDALLLTAITSLRRIASNLRPRALDEGGLYFALQSLQHEFQQRHGIRCHLDAREQDLVLDDRYSTAIYRLAQESLTNIARHASATEAWLRLATRSGSLHIAISDNGRGISKYDMEKPESLGLIGMRERVSALRGRMEVVGDAGGTLVDIRIPLPE